ncbi:MAG: hypothetical protein HQM16_16620 [Deltaproteobacteria bacterium]|nr:hypothetical protein [Deltaproteobacteria bacterium]
MVHKLEIYISTDVEADGPIPGMNSMLSFGSAAYLEDKTLAMALLKTNYRKSTKRNMPKKWFDPLPHSHQALDDAIEQGALFCNMLRELKSSDSS